MDKNYILIIGWVAVMAMLSVLTSVKRVETVCGKKEYRWRPVWAVVTLTGSQALAHARNRTLGNDFERTRRQRSVMYGIYRKIMEKKDPSALLPLINYAVNHVKTNMSVSEMYSMAKDVLSVDDLKMQQTCIPQDGTYTDITYEGMQVLKVDFDANKKKIEQLLY